MTSSGISYFVILTVVIFIFSMFKVLPEWEKGVILRFGRLMSIRGPGLIIVIPLVERIIRVDTRTITMDIPSQDVITSDNVSMKVNAVIYFRVTEPNKAVTQVADYYFATSQLAQTTLRSVLGQYEMDDLLSSRDRINKTLQDILDKATEPWGIKVSVVEVKHIDLPKEMQRAMAKQAEAERERRAKIISAEGEMQRAEKLSSAAETLSGHPEAIQLAYLQTLSEIASESSTKTIVFPVPMKMVKGFFDSKE